MSPSSRGQATREVVSANDRSRAELAAALTAGRSHHFNADLHASRQQATSGEPLIPRSATHEETSANDRSRAEQATALTAGRSHHLNTDLHASRRQATSGGRPHPRSSDPRGGVRQRPLACASRRPRNTGEDLTSTPTCTPRASRQRAVEPSSRGQATREAVSANDARARSRRPRSTGEDLISSTRAVRRAPTGSDRSEPSRRGVRRCAPPAADPACPTHARRASREYVEPRHWVNGPRVRRHSQGRTDLCAHLLPHRPPPPVAASVVNR